MIVGYIRVSTDEQANSGLSLEYQRSEIEKWAAAKGQECVIFEDAGFSGSLPIDRRPGLQSAVSSVRKGDTLLVVKRDRLARDPIVSGGIEYLVSKSGGKVVTIEDGESPDELTGNIMKLVKDMVAMVELHSIRMRTRAAMSAKKARKELCGRLPPLGYKLNFETKKLEPDYDELRMIAYAMRLWDLGYKPQRIAKILNDRGEITHAERHFRRLREYSGDAPGLTPESIEKSCDFGMDSNYVRKLIFKTRRNKSLRDMINALSRGAGDTEEFELLANSSAKKESAVNFVCDGSVNDE
ncbi:MAG: hypothetical protein KatS3mg104_3033 [Phycisphaerae bacterium]|nr:MAG: hypothetical protein KatS3mg104_3033 [Phycisphaerae bacterium]